MTDNRFDAAFYRGFYLDPATRVTTREDIAKSAGLVASVLQRLDIPVTQILDAGCGLGWFRRPLLKAFPSASYTGFEVSDYLCEQYGWTHASLTTFRTQQQFDLVICHDVVQYLSDREAARALANFGRWCRGVLYLHVPTSADWGRNVDTACSDGNVYQRTAEWYQTRLRRRFRHLGFGLMLRRDIWVPQWELEAPWQ
jgi:trans-aconitate methyltransferase